MAVKIAKKKNTIKGVLWGTINRTVTLLLPFIIRTIIVRKLGIEYVGIHSILNSIINVLNLTEFGLSSAIIFSMYKPIAEDNCEEICGLLNLYRKAYKLIGISIGIIGFIVMPFISVFIRGGITVNVNIYILFMIYLCNTVTSYILFAYKQSLYIAHQRNDILYKIQTYILLLQYIFQIIVLCFLENYYLYCILILTFTIIQNLIVNNLSKKDYQKYYCSGYPSIKARKLIKKQMKGIIIGRCNSVVRNQIDTLFISTFLGIQLSAIYSNYYYIITSVTGFITIFINVMTAGIGNATVTENKDKNYVQFNVILLLIQWLIGITGILVIILIQPFMNVWVGSNLMFENKKAILFGLYYFALNVDLTRVLYSSALGFWWEMRKILLVDMILNFIFNLIFIHWLEVDGVIIATIVVSILYSVPASGYILFKKYFGLNKFRQYILRMINFAIVFLVLSALAYYLCFFTEKLTSSLARIFFAIIAIIVASLCYLLLIISSKYGRDMLNLIKRHNVI